VSTANPNAMTAWNARMLDELWQAIFDHLEGRDGGVPAQLERIRRDALGVVSEPAERAQLETFLAHAPERYLLANGIDAIRRHAAIVEGRSGALAFGANEMYAPAPAAL